MGLTLQNVDQLCEQLTLFVDSSLSILTQINFNLLVVYQEFFCFSAGLDVEIGNTPKPNLQSEFICSSLLIQSIG